MCKGAEAACEQEIEWCTDEAIERFLIR